MQKLTALAAAGLIGIVIANNPAVAKPLQSKANVTAQQPSMAKKKKVIAVTSAAKKKKPAITVTSTVAKKKNMATMAVLAPTKTAVIRKRDDCNGFFECLFGRDRNASGGSGFGIGSEQTRQIVDWNEPRYKPGSIIVKTPERALYYVLPGGEAYRYRVGVGREGFQWSGNSRIVSKQEWPEWRPPEEMIQREAEKGHFLPDVMEGGPDNPLGARAMYIGGTLFRIHGTNDAASIGGAVSSGCIRMMNADVIDLYDRVRIGARVYVYQ
jgi:lipoprotein-anchoring transpeptidase ErfK/SrfK